MAFKDFIWCVRRDSMSICPVLYRQFASNRSKNKVLPVPVSLKYITVIFKKNVNKGIDSTG